MNNRRTIRDAMAELERYAALVGVDPHNDPLYHCGTPWEDGRTYGSVPNPDSRRLREFKINGQKIMAYSRKDAIKRLKHRKK